jgi:hypothetical protein
MAQVSPWLSAVQASHRRFAGLVARLDGPGLSAPTACTEWTNLRLVPAIVDRVTFNGHIIIETGSESFRLATTRAKRAGGKTT